MEFIDPSALPPQFMEAIRHQIDQGNMQRDSDLHEFKNLFAALDREQLVALRRLLHIASHHGLSMFYEGQITAMLLLKYEICTCGADHDAEAEAIKQQSVEEVEPGQQPPGVAPPGEAELMKQYGLEWAPQDDLEDTPVMQCQGCKTPVFSLEDRMRRDPGVKGCSICQQNAKWG